MANMDKQLCISERRVQNLIRETIESDLYTSQNKKLVFEFVNTCRAKNLSSQRICFYLDRLKQISKILKKDFKKWDRKDVEYVMAKIGELGYSDWTVECVKTTFKVFYRWIYGLDSNDPAPKLVRWINSRNIPTDIRREDLLTKKDIQDMMNSTNQPMHKALIAVLNAGARPGETLNIKIKDIKRLNGLVKIYVSGKMDKKMGERPLYITEYVDEFTAWVRRHPNKYAPDAVLFHSNNGFLTYANMVKIVKRLALRAGIMRFKRDEKGNIIRDMRGKAIVEGKRVWPYLFRHTAGTRYYGKYEGSYARRLMGHAAGSKMEGVYCHLSEADIESRLLGKNMPEDSEPDFPTVERETEEILALGKAIKKIAETHPEVIDIEKLQGLLSL